MIYFIRRSDNGRIKIGTTIRLTRRLAQLASETQCDLEVLAVTDGGMPREKTLHRQFARLRAVNEWFEPGDDLTAFIVKAGRPWDGSDEAPPLCYADMTLDVIETARIVSAYRNEPMTEMLSRILRPVLAKMEKEEVAKRSK